jgi:ATP-dependent Clp protease adaptor protein ClpS
MSEKTRHEEGVKTKERPKTRPPSLYKVVLHNDDYTPMEFVVAVLVQIFHLAEPEATRIMLQVHHEGVGVAGVFPFEVAETKVAQVLGAAQAHEFPLQCSLEPE